MLKVIKVITIVSLIFLGGCEIQVQDQDQKQKAVLNVSSQSVKIEYPDWREIAPGAAIRQYAVEDDQSLADIVNVLRLDQGKFYFRIFNDPAEPKTVSAWQQQENALAVINGSYFDESYNPTGLLIVGAEKFGQGSADGSNGYTAMLIFDEGKSELRYLPEKNYDLQEEFDYALQTYPTLILPGGIPGIKEDSGLLAQRTIWAKDRKGSDLIISTESNYFSLYEIMLWLLNSDLEIDIAANLDGGPSSGLAIESEGVSFLEESTTVPNVIAVFVKK